MKCIKRLISTVLCALIVLSTLPVASLAASSEIWPGYPGVDQLPAINTIPNPFEFFNSQNDPNGDGYVSDPAEWTARSNEIKELVQRYWLGYRWPTKAEDVAGETKVVSEPNEISVGFSWPPYSYPTVFNLKDEFDNLTSKLMTQTVEIHELVPGTYGSTSEGAIKFTFGPAADQAEAESLALDAWNSGYYLPYTSFGLPYHAVLKDSTGTLSAPPEATKPVTYQTVTVTNPDSIVTTSGVSASFNISVTKPTPEQITAVWGDPNAKVPVIIDIGGSVSQVSTVTQQGYAYINFTPTDIYPDDSEASDGINRDGVYTKLYPYNKDVYEYASGAEMAWGWGVSQIINALGQPTSGSALTWGQELGIDPAKTLVTGHSRYGKASLFAAAFDDRISICLASESGGSGIQSYRYKVEGKIFNWNTYAKADRVFGKTEIPTVSYGGGSSWFPETAANFVNKDNQLPFDSSDIISLVAPRPFFATTGLDAHWLGNEGAVAAVQAASEVYNYIGKDEIQKTNAAVRARQSDHVLYNRDVPFVIAIMDREFKQTSDKKLHVKDLFPSGDDTLGNISYPAKDYDNVSEFNSYPFDINSSYLPWSSPDKYTLWTPQENFLVGYPVTITAHSNAPDVKLYLPGGTAVSATSHNGEVLTFDLTAEQAVYGRYELRTDGGGKESRSVFFAAVSLSDSLRHATSKGDEGEENRLIGFSSRLENNAGNPPQVYIDGKQTTMSFTPSRVVPEETSLLEYGILFHDPLFARIANEGWDASKTFDIKNLKFVTIPKFTFEISFGNITASAGNSGKDGAASFTQPISWNVEKFNNGPAAVWPLIPDTKAEKDILAAGGTVTRPDAPAPKATAFDTKIVSTEVQHVGDKTNVVINFDSELDTREFGFGVDVASSWGTTWSEDKKQVTLSIDYDKFPEGSDADIIIFHLKDTDGNMIPGPIYLPLSLPAVNPDIALVNAAVTAIHNGTYQIPLANQTSQTAKTAWVKAAVNALIPKGNGSTATVAYSSGYAVSVTKGLISKPATITVTEVSSGENSGNYTSTPTSTPTPTATPTASTVTMQPTLSGSTGIIKVDDAKAKDLLAKGTTINVPAIAGATAYSVGLPAAALTGAQAGGTLTVSTNAGKITIPDNMLTGTAGISGKDAGIAIGQGNKADLPANVKAALGNRPLVQLSLSVDGKQTEWNNPNAPVTVSIAYTPTQEEQNNPENIVVWYIDGSGKVVTVPNGRYDAKTGTVTFATTHFSLYAVSFVQKSFSDIGSVAWAKKSIEVLAAKDIVKTPSATTYNPASNITRADFLYSLVRTLGANTKTSGNFDDISKDAYYYNEIAIAKALGITTGEGNNRFGPDHSITRQDMMAMTERTLKLLKKVNQQGAASLLDKFTDKNSISSYAVNSVATIVKEGLIVGSNNRINPTGNTTRAEAAVFLYRVYNKY